VILFLGTISDLVADFLYYDRKKDEQLPRGAIEAAIAAKEITFDEIVSKFTDELKRGGM
jgi:hypothetical protein